MNQIDGKSLLRAVKAAACSGPAQLYVPVGCPPIAMLRPLAARSDGLSSADISAITKWRNQHRRSFLTEFDATVEGTMRWLTQSIGPNDNRILFMIEDLTGRVLGHMGLTNIDWNTGSGELDVIVRGEEAPRGTAKECLLTLLKWATRCLGLKAICLRVRADNRAVGFYESCEFVEYRRVPLRRVEQPESTAWIEDPAAANSTLSVIYMRWSPHVRETQMNDSCSRT